MKKLLFMAAAALVMVSCGKKDAETASECDKNCGDCQEQTCGEEITIDEDEDLGCWADYDNEEYAAEINAAADEYAAEIEKAANEYAAEIEKAAKSNPAKAMETATKAAEKAMNDATKAAEKAMQNATSEAEKAMQNAMSAYGF